MKNNLQLNLFLKPNNRTCLVFRKNEILYRIDNLLHPLPFVANMVQLKKAIDTEAEQDCCLELCNTKNKRWKLECRYLNRIVGLNLWIDTGLANGHPELKFCWDGKPGHFGAAVRDMSMMVQHAPKRV